MTYIGNEENPFGEKIKKKVVFCTPSYTRPVPEYLESLEKCLPLIEQAGWEHGFAQQVGCPYISAARANMTRAALDVNPAAIVYIDSDMSWTPQAMLKLLETDGEVVAGTYRCKIDDEQYMGTIYSHKETDCPCGESPCNGILGTPVVRADGAIKAVLVPAGFLKVSIAAIDKFMVAYPELCYGPMYHQAVDLFNHGVRDRIWWGEDYSFSRRWREKCGDIWIVPDLDLDHCPAGKVYKGNFHEFLLRQPGGSKSQEVLACQNG